MKALRTFSLFLILMYSFTSIHAEAEHEMDIKVIVLGQDGQVIPSLKIGLIPQRSFVHFYNYQDNARFLCQDKEPEENETFLIEIYADGYKAKVLEYKRDFQGTEKELIITLEQGPYAFNESVFTSVTGRPATEHEVTRMPHADVIRGKEKEYRYLAALGNVPPEKMPSKPRNKGFYTPSHSAIAELKQPFSRILRDTIPHSKTLPLVKVQQEDGSIIDSIYIQWAYSGLEVKKLTEVNAMPASGFPPRMLHAPNGLYRIPNNVYLWSEGMEKVFIPASLSNNESTSPISIQLSSTDRQKEGRIKKWRFKRNENAIANPEALIAYWHEHSRIPLPNRVLTSIRRNNGKKMIQFVSKVIEEPDSSYHDKQTALIVLARIGTAESAAAFKKIRDTARNFADAPQEKPSYTHQERIIEAAEMVMHVIPGKDPQGTAKPINGHVRITADYKEAQVNYGGYFSFGTIRLTRVGDEWMVTDIGPMISA